MENKVIVRRFVGGILLILASAYTFYRAINIFNMKAKFSNVLDSKLLSQLDGNGRALILLGIIDLLIGVIYVLTRNKRPRKLTEYGIVVGFIIGGVLCGMLAGYIEPITKMLAGTASILVIIGLPGKKGFKNMPFLTKEEIKNGVVSTPIMKKESSNGTLTTQLTELKKLLDDDLITQEEFDAKKKQILKL